MSCHGVQTAHIVYVESAAGAAEQRVIIDNRRAVELHRHIPVRMSQTYISLRRNVKTDALNMTEETPSRMAMSTHCIACRWKILLAS